MENVVFKKLWEMLFGKKSSETPSEEAALISKDSEAAKSAQPAEEQAKAAAAPQEAKVPAPEKASPAKADEAAQAFTSQKASLNLADPEAEAPTPSKLVVEHPNATPNLKETMQLDKDAVRQLLQQTKEAKDAKDAADKKAAEEEAAAKSNFKELPETVQLDKKAVQKLLEDYKKQQADAAKPKPAAPAPKKTLNLAGESTETKSDG